MQTPTDAAVEPPVDLALLRRFTLGDVALEKEILSLFLDHAPQTLANLENAATHQDWRVAAHTLKGSSSAVGAYRVANLAADAERLEPSQDAEKQQSIAAVRIALEAARDYIAQLHANPAPR